MRFYLLFVFKLLYNLNTHNMLFCLKTGPYGGFKTPALALQNSLRLHENVWCNTHTHALYS